MASILPTISDTSIFAGLWSSAAGLLRWVAHLAASGWIGGCCDSLDAYGSFRIYFGSGKLGLLAGVQQRLAPLWVIGNLVGMGWMPGMLGCRGPKATTLVFFLEPF